MLEKRKLLGYVLRKEEEGADANGRGGATSDGRGGISDGKGNKDPGGRDGDNEGNGGKHDAGTAGTEQDGGDKQGSDPSHTAADAATSQDVTQETAAEVDQASLAEAAQQRALAQMARQGLVVDTDQTGAIVGATPERAASFGLFGANDLGTGSLRARTPSEMASYGIDLGSLSAADRINAIDPSRTIASDVQRAATTGLTALGGPVGSVVGMGVGHSIDSAVTNSRLKDLGYSDTQARAIAESAIGARTAGRAVGMIGSAAVGPVAGAIAGLSDNPVSQMALDAATKKAASYGLSLAGQSFADRYGDQVYGDIMAGKTPSSPQGNPLGSDGDRYAVAANAPGRQTNIASAQPAADIDIGSDFYDYVSKFGGSHYG